MREHRADVEKTLEALLSLKSKAGAGETLTSHFDYADNVFVKASITPRDVVYIWLGANVMLEFTYAEAEAFLTEQLETYQLKLVRAGRGGEEVCVSRGEVVRTRWSAPSSSLQQRVRHLCLCARAG
jgi:hypothetical protein